MKRGRFTKEQIIGVLKEQEASVKTARLDTNGYRKRQSTTGRPSMASVGGSTTIGLLSRQTKTSAVRKV